MKGYTISASRRADILADLLSGMKRAQVAIKYDVHRDTVARIARDHAAGRTRREESAEERECDMSEAELEQMIAEQMPTMPKEPSDGFRWPRLPQVVARGRGTHVGRGSGWLSEVLADS